jgi:hypothetical protein
MLLVRVILPRLLAMLHMPKEWVQKQVAIMLMPKVYGHMLKMRRLTPKDIVLLPKDYVLTLKDERLQRWVVILMLKD